MTNYIKIMTLLGCSPCDRSHFLNAFNPTYEREWEIGNILHLTIWYPQHLSFAIPHQKQSHSAKDLFWKYECEMLSSRVILVKYDFHICLCTFLPQTKTHRYAKHTGTHLKHLPGSIILKTVFSYSSTFAIFSMLKEKTTTTTTKNPNLNSFNIPSS